MRLRQDAFLAAFERLCHISQAAEEAGIQRRTHYDWLAADPEYKARFEASDVIATKALEDEAARRALHGVEEPVWHQGMQCGSVLKYSDRLMEFLLKGRDPAKYGDRFKAEHSGPGGGAIQTNATLQIKIVQPTEAEDGGDR
jgi:hypothetical protein